MNIQTVIANLLNTIEGKETYLRALKKKGYDSTGVRSAVIEFLELNLEELNNILNDCMAVREADIVRNLEANEAKFNDNDSDEVRNLISIGR